MFAVGQKPPGPPARDFALLLDEALGGNARKAWRPGSRIALAVGSRGISHLAAIVRRAADLVRSARAHPFIIPAMGSHGGATAEGQQRILADYGVTERSVGAPIEASMETARIGDGPDGTGVFCGAAVRQADGIVLINRVKPHTDFAGELGSGLQKMAVVGLGKHAGAQAFHRVAHRAGYVPALRGMARVSLAKLPVTSGVAIVEDAGHETSLVEIVPAETIESREPELLQRARQLMGRLPVDEIDLLIVDRLGKNISGTGMDTNVIGRQIHGYSLLAARDQDPPRIRRIFVRELTPETHGNATGIGMADLTTTRLVRSIDRDITYTNALTALSLQGAKIPLHFDTDRECIGHALASLGLADAGEARVVRIIDTLSLGTMLLSENYLPLVASRPDLVQLGEPAAMGFDEAGNLLSFQRG